MKLITRFAFVLSFSLSLSLSPLPPNISPYDNNSGTGMATRSAILRAVDASLTKAIEAGETLIEVEFPPLLTLSGSKRKSQFDDFDNISELDANKDFAIELMTLNREALQSGKDCWLLFPDLKELETSASEWVGEKFSKVTRTTIEAATECITGGQFVKPWGSQFVSAVSSMINDPEKTTSTLLGDTSYLDEISSIKPPMLSIAVQPGNGGPVEDWINLEKYSAACSDGHTLCVVNGALDKVRDGYYPAFAFPSLAKTASRFYTNFSAAYYLRPISDKGLYGWVYRQYGEPYQVVMQKPLRKEDGSVTVEDVVVWTGDDVKPSFVDAVRYMIEAVKDD